MTTLTLAGNRIGEALQFNGNGNNVAIEIGQVWFAATDTVRITFAPGSFDAVTGQLTGGAGAVTGFTVTTASGQVTTFGVSAGNALDVDPDQSKNGADFFFISESPMAGMGGAYAGVQLEKIVVADAALIGGTSPVFNSVGGYVPPGGIITPEPPQLIGDAGNNTLTGTAAANVMDGREGNDTIRSLAGNDNVLGGQGNDRIDAGTGNDIARGGEGDDRLVGNDGTDRLFGDAGNDILDGGRGRDQMTGGVGGDTFVFGNLDTVRDFNASEGDQIAFNAALGLSLGDITVAVGSNSTTVTFGTQVMTLTGVNQPFDLGNAFDFGYVPSFDFV
ncbi:MAG: calcium-binding protein [Paracoccaceae bacterium]